MPIKTKEEMFGDGAGFGPMVPVSLVAPGGHSAGNRGIAFGEQLTSAIANRTHYALALNDEDLDTRVGVFEADGLDGAYRLGAVATPGGGRTITLDGGAVETQSTLATEYDDDIANAHFRANALGDSIKGSTGFEFVSDLDPSDVVSGTGWAGFIDRRALGIQAGGYASLFGASESITLNPGSAGATIVRLNTGGQKFWTSEAGPTPPAGSYTSLRLGVDLIELSGTNDDGLYIIAGLGPTGQDVTLLTLNGAAPSFTADDTGTGTVHRIRLASIGTEFSGTRVDLRGGLVSAPKGGGAAFDFYGGGEAGSGAAARYRYANELGATVTARTIDEYGRDTFTLLSEQLRYTYTASRRPVHAGGGAFATKVTREGSSGGGGEFAHLVTAADATVRGRFDFTSLAPYLPAGIANLDASIPFDFIAASPTNGRLDLTSASLAAAAWTSMLEYGMLVEIVSGSGDTAGYYVLTAHVSGSEYIEVRELNHTLTSHFPTSGSGTLRFHAASRLGGSEQTLVNGVEGLTFNARTQITPYNVMVGGPEVDSTALVIMTPGNPLGTEDRAALSIYKNEAGFNPLEIFAVMPQGQTENGYFEAYQGVIHENFWLSNSGSPDAEVLYGTPGTPALRTRTFRVQLSDVISEAEGTSVKWEVDGGTGVSTHFLKSLTNQGYGYIPINQYLRTGMNITGCRVRINVNGSGHVTGGERVFAGIYYVDTSMVAVAAATPTLVGSDNDGATAGFQTIDVGSTIGGGSHAVDLSDRDYYVYIRSSIDGGSNDDEIHAIELTVEDPGPRNY